MYKYVKRVIDIFLCIIAIIVLFPLYIFASIGILISSPGTILYHSMRAGINKKPFKFYKFRSMHIGEKKDMFIADPDRVFPFGRLIRRLKIDELPQLFNVLKGDMSIVGPRPMTVERVDELYCGKYEMVSRVKPGLTSAASLYDYIVGDNYSDNVAYQKEVLPVKKELELLYIKKESFLYDASLIWRTVKTIILVAVSSKKYPVIPELEEIKNVHE